MAWEVHAPSWHWRNRIPLSLPHLCLLPSFMLALTKFIQQYFVLSHIVYSYAEIYLKYSDWMFKVYMIRRKYCKLVFWLQTFIDFAFFFHFFIAKLLRHRGIFIRRMAHTSHSNEIKHIASETAVYHTRYFHPCMHVHAYTYGDYVCIKQNIYSSLRT